MLLHQFTKNSQIDFINPRDYARRHTHNLNINQGLYVLIFENKLESKILDPKPKVVVSQFGASIKPGRFERSFPIRLSEYVKDMRFDSSDSNLKSAFELSFVCGFVLDLSLNKDTFLYARIFEQYWIQEINLFLVHEKVLGAVQNKHSEWRNIEPDKLTPEFLDKFHSNLQVVVNKISLMQKII